MKIFQISFCSTFRVYSTPKDFWDSIAFCLEVGGRLIGPEEVQLIDTNEEINQLPGGLFRTSGYWSELERSWFDAANTDANSPFSKIIDWGSYIEPTMCGATGGNQRRFVSIHRTRIALTCQVFAITITETF